MTANASVAARAALRTLRQVGWLEGTSFLLLLFVAMPLKYLAGLPLAVRIVGLVHGLLFIWYVVALGRAATERGWDLRRRAFGFVAAIVPFGLFAFDAVLRRELAALDARAGAASASDAAA